MRFTRPLVVLTIAGLTLGSAAVAMQPAEDSTATTRPAGKAKPIRLTNPWNKVADLTDEQKAQINQIHVETVEKIKQLQKEEDDRCMAILNDEQRKALEETQEQDKVARKSRAAKKE